MTHTQIARLRELGHLIAFVWAPLLGWRDALHAANNALAPMTASVSAPFGVLILRALDHRRRVFGWRLDDKTVDFLAQQAIRVWVTHGGPELEAAVHRRHLFVRITALARDRELAEAAS